MSVPPEVQAGLQKAREAVEKAPELEGGEPNDWYNDPRGKETIDKATARDQKIHDAP